VKADKPVPLTKIISGGQTGVDRAALEAAIAVGLKIGGAAPRGLWAEDGTIPASYNLTPVEEADLQTSIQRRTQKNVSDADATLILRVRADSPGTSYTIAFAQKLNKPLLVVDLAQPPDYAFVAAWLREQRVATLNIAGPRESTSPGIFQRARAYLLGLFQKLGK
jgi:hypothetical protein